MNVVNGSIGYRFDNGWRIQLDALNLLNSATDQVTYAYGGLLTSDALFARCYPVQKVAAAVCSNGVMDYSFHPMEPLAFRLTLAGPLETIGTLNIRKMAAEMKRSFPAEPLHAGDYNWTGFYVGAHLGMVWSSTNGSTVNTATGAMSAPLFVGSAADWNGGIQVGYDYMMPNRVVVGLEADVSSGGSKTTNITDASGTSANQTRVFDTESIRGRLGYSFDNVLLYGTGGWAWSSDQFIRTQLTGMLNLATAGTDEAVNTYLGGWTAGAGAAVTLAQNWSAFAEYRYTDYGSSSATLPFSRLATTSATKVSEVDVGINYKFDWTASPDANAPTYKPPAAALLQKAPSISHAFTWTGLYIGGDGGYGWNVANAILTTVVGAPLTAYDYNVHGPFAGVFAGGNYQLGSFVAGVEGDWQRGNLAGNNQTPTPLGAGGASPGLFTISTTIKDDELVRGRLGMAFGRFLLFGTAGWAWGNPTNAYAMLSAAPFTASGGNASGWTAGFGLDYAFADNVFGRLEYRYTDLKTSGFVNAAADAADAGNGVPINDLRVGIAYKFGPLIGND